MQVRGTSCCGVREMAGISEHATPQAVLKTLGEKMYEPRRKMNNRWGDYTDPHWGSEGKKMYAHYIFTAVVRHTGKDEGPPVQNGEYGDRLAAYIREHRLGDVVVSAEDAPNRVNNPTHVIRVYVWTPQPRRFQAWYLRSKADGKRVKAAKRPRVQTLPEASVPVGGRAAEAR